MPITTPERILLLFVDGNYLLVALISMQQTPRLCSVATSPFRIFRHKDSTLFHNKQFFCLFLIFSLCIPCKMRIFASKLFMGH